VWAGVTLLALLAMFGFLRLLGNNSLVVMSPPDLGYAVVVGQGFVTVLDGVAAYDKESGVVRLPLHVEHSALARKCLDAIARHRLVGKRPKDEVPPFCVDEFYKDSPPMGDEAPALPPVRVTAEVRIVWLILPCAAACLPVLLGGWYRARRPVSCQADREHTAPTARSRGAQRRRGRLSRARRVLRPGRALYRFFGAAAFGVVAWLMALAVVSHPFLLSARWAPIYDELGAFIQVADARITYGNERLCSCHKARAWQLQIASLQSEADDARTHRAAMTWTPSTARPAMMVQANVRILELVLFLAACMLIVQVAVVSMGQRGTPRHGGQLLRPHGVARYRQMMAPYARRLAGRAVRGALLVLMVVGVYMFLRAESTKLELYGVRGSYLSMMDPNFVVHSLTMTIDDLAMNLASREDSTDPLTKQPVMAITESYYSTYWTLLPAAIGVAIGLYRGIRCLRRGPLPAFPCGSCGYDLTGNLSGTCPECGNLIGTPVLVENTAAGRVPSE
jgi:hypothetical protein